MSDRAVIKEKNNSNKNAAEAHHHHQRQHQQEKRSSKSNENIAADTFFKRYKVIEKIGEGSYSEVLKCQNRYDQSIVACKRLKHTYKSWNELNNISEVATLRAIEKHPNILQMLEIHYDETLGKVSLVFEIMDVNLYELIKDRRKLLGESRVRNFMVQLFRALRHLHKLGIFHRDIKPENILIRTKNDLLKLGDLGSVRGIYSKAPYTEYISTRWYRSPECLLTAGHYSQRMDIWAAGCVFYEVLTLRPLFPGSSELDQINRINNILGPPPMKLLEVFQKQADMERESYRGQSQLNRRQQIQKILDGYSSRYIVVNDSKNSSNKSIKSRSRNTVEYHFAGREGTGLDKLLSNAISHEAKEIIKGCLQYDPELRPTAHKILLCNYFADLRKEEVPIKIEKGSMKPVITICGEAAVEHCEATDLRTLGDNKIRYRRGHQVKPQKRPSKQGVSKPDVNNNYSENTPSVNEVSVMNLSRSRISNDTGDGSKQTSQTNVSNRTTRKSSSIVSVANNNKEQRTINKAQHSSKPGKIGHHNMVEPEVISSKAKSSQIVIHHQKKPSEQGKQQQRLQKKEITSSSTSFESVHSSEKMYKYKSTSHQVPQTKHHEKPSGATKDTKTGHTIPFADVALSPYIKAPSELRFLQKKIKGDQQHQHSNLGRNKPVMAPSNQNVASHLPHKAESVKISSIQPPKATAAAVKYVRSSNAASNVARQFHQTMAKNNHSNSNIKEAIAMSSGDGAYSPPDDDATSYSVASSVKVGKLLVAHNNQEPPSKNKGKSSPSPHQRSKIPQLVDENNNSRYPPARGSSQNRAPFKVTSKLTSPPERSQNGRGMGGGTEKWRNTGNTGISRRVTQNQISPDREREQNIRLLRQSLTMDKDNKLKIVGYQPEDLQNNNATSSTNASFLTRVPDSDSRSALAGKNNSNPYNNYSSQETMGKQSQPRLTDGTYSSGRYLNNSTTDFENPEIQESSSLDSRNIIYNPGAIVTRMGNKMSVLTEDGNKKSQLKKKGVNDLYPPEIIYSSRYRAPNLSNMNVLKNNANSNYGGNNNSKHQQEAKTQDVKERLNNKIEQRRRQQANHGVGVGDHPSKLMSERSSSFLNPNDYKKQYSTTLLTGRAEEQQQYARPTIQSKTGRVERRPPIPPGKVLGLQTSADIRHRPRQSSPVPRNEPMVPQSSYRHSNNSHTGRIPVMSNSTLEKCRVPPGASSKSNPHGRRMDDVADHIRKEFRDTQRKRSERMKSTMRDEVFCSSDDDVVTTMRKKFDSLISERARKLSESLKGNVASNIGSGRYRNNGGGDSDDNNIILSQSINSRTRNVSNHADKSKKHARRELRARMAESLTMSNRFESVNWRLPDSMCQEGTLLGRLDNRSVDCAIPQSSYNNNSERIGGGDKSKYAHVKEQMKYHHQQNDYSKNNHSKYQNQTRHVSETNRIYPFSRHEQTKNRNGQIYTPPGNKPVYQSPQVGGGGLLTERNLRYSHNIPVLNRNPGNHNNHSNYSQRGRNQKDFTDMKNRPR